MVQVVRDEQLTGAAGADDGRCGDGAEVDRLQRVLQRAPPPGVQVDVGGRGVGHVPQRLLRGRDPAAGALGVRRMEDLHPGQLGGRRVDDAADDRALDGPAPAPHALDDAR